MLQPTVTFLCISYQNHRFHAKYMFLSLQKHVMWYYVGFNMVVGPIVDEWGLCLGTKTRRERTEWCDTNEIFDSKVKNGSHFKLNKWGWIWFRSSPASEHDRRIQFENSNRFWGIWGRVADIFLPSFRTISHRISMIYLGHLKLID